ncbi:hypothetical protein [Nostoc sp. PA-18-2419]|nr:hypothetical protein [Nostoc sp. PA-18-2419]
MSKTRVNNDGSFTTDDGGRDRQATPEEIDKMLQQWEEQQGGKKSKKR